MNSYVILCSECMYPVEAVVLAPSVTTYRASPAMADDHVERRGHWPVRVQVHPAHAIDILYVGRKA